MAFPKQIYILCLVVIWLWISEGVWRMDVAVSPQKGGSSIHAQRCGILVSGDSPQSGGGDPVQSWLQAQDCCLCALTFTCCCPGHKHIPEHLSPPCLWEELGEGIEQEHWTPDTNPSRNWGSRCYQTDSPKGGTAQGSLHTLPMLQKPSSCRIFGCAHVCPGDLF